MYDYILYKDFLKEKNFDKENILVARTSNSYLIGPKIDESFDSESFKKRIKSNCIYNTKIYKSVKKDICLKYIDKYYKDLQSNEVIEIFDDKIIKHKIIHVPGC